MAAVYFDVRFTYVLAGWEAAAHDALVLRDALERENGLRVPQGKYYLVDAGYGAKPGFLPPFRGVWYHLKEWGRGSNSVQNEKELFNLRHSSLRVTVERAFGALKRRFKSLDDAITFFPFPTQVDIVVACCIIHNWVIQDGVDDFFLRTIQAMNKLQQSLDKQMTMLLWFISGNKLLIRCGQIVKTTMLTNIV
ncbi:uncharacterized protein LOC120648854 [Panicum virgatum]|uniref:uncharacterized protein LOC120648854 n=1 Tax=Panicum virgatum TaxID=38727 RepID=UPI0019D54590|nr:uncharacterized protein LOC120648854 [Panicum virgatum]